MQTKPSWTATNDEGVKLFYYDKLGWIDSVTGCVQPFDLALVKEKIVPADATHIQIHRGAVNYVRKTTTDYCLQNERGEWICCGSDVGGISGTVIRLSDGYVASRDCGPPVLPDAPNVWHAQDPHSPPPSFKDSRVEVEYSNGARSFGLVRNFNWTHLGSLGDIVRWRYAA